MDKLLFVLITGIISMILLNSSNGSCRPKTQQVAFDVTDQIPKSPIGLQQCERECFSDTNCQVMVYNVNNLACYKATNINAATTTGRRAFVVKLRSHIAINLDSAYLCTNHQCGIGFSCIALSRGGFVCMAGLCGQPVTIRDAAVNVNSHSISSIATYSCNDGYHSIGTSTIMCGSSLEWTETTLVCCKNGFTYDQGTQMMFKVILQRKTYHNSLSHCESLGSGLIKVNTTDKMEVLWGHLSTDAYYTDASDRVKESEWRFSDGSDVDMRLFHPSEPNGGMFQNCAIFGKGNKLIDVPCYTAEFFICEVR